MTAWLLLSVPEGEFKAAGVRPYGDDLRRCYRYDSRVPNNKRIQPGDLALVRTKDQLVGISKIERIETTNGQKDVFRCPGCRSTNLQKRKRKKPMYVCAACGEDFEEPVEEVVQVTKFAAYYSDEFFDTTDAISLDLLRDACPRYSSYLSMQELAIESISGELQRACPGVELLLSMLPRQ